MQTSKQPAWNPEVKVVCACGNTFTTGSTLSEIRVEICSNCHPLFTGQQKFVDTLGQVDRFIKRTEAAKAKQQELKQIMESRKTRNEQRKNTEHQSLKDLLMSARKKAAS